MPNKNKREDGDKLAFHLYDYLKEKYSFKLKPRIAGMNNSPKLNNCDYSKDSLKLIIENEVYEVGLEMRFQNEETIREAVVYMYGDGVLRYNYNLPLFGNIDEERIEYYKRLALEFWDRNIHREYMKERGYPFHNASKEDIEFCRLQAQKRRAEAIKRHHLQSREHVKGNTAHHTTITPQVFIKILSNEDYGTFKQDLEEMIADQSTTRCRWYRIVRDYYSERKKTFLDPVEIQNIHKKEGLWLKDEEENELRFIEGDIRSKFHKEIWDVWVTNCDEFIKYWIKNFGKANEYWNPPVEFKEILNLI